MIKQRSSGFTLIELMVVIGIIALLVGVLVTVVMVAQSKGLEGQTRDFVSTTVPAAIQQWQDKNGKNANQYPPSGSNSEEKPYEGNALLFEALVTSLQDRGQPPLVPAEAFAEDTEDGKKVFVDPWGTPYIYRNWTAPPPKKGGKKATKQAKPINSSSYDLISAGPDTQFGTADDIVYGQD